MSHCATHWAWLQTGLKPTCKLVLLALADRADEQNCCYPSIARLVADTGLNRKTIIAVLQSLRELHLIEDTGDRKGSTKSVPIYRLLGVVKREDVPKTEPVSSPKTGTTKQSQKRNSSENGTAKQSQKVPPSSPKNGTGKQSQKRDTEPTILEPVNEPVSKKVAPGSAAPRAAPPTSATWESYSEAYQARYGVTPIRNAKVNGQLGQLVQRVGGEMATMVAAYYLTCNRQFYVARGHQVGPMLADAEQLAAEVNGAQRTTSTQARNADKHQAQGDVFRRLLERAEE